MAFDITQLRGLVALIYINNFTCLLRAEAIVMVEFVKRNNQTVTKYPTRHSEPAGTFF
jgi:hypothetical protein